MSAVHGASPSPATAAALPLPTTLAPRSLFGMPKPARSCIDSRDTPIMSTGLPFHPMAVFSFPGARTRRFACGVCHDNHRTQQVVAERKRYVQSHFADLVSLVVRLSVPSRLGWRGQGELNARCEVTPGRRRCDRWAGVASVHSQEDVE